MAAGRNELRMIWLITLLITGISAWYLGYQIVTYLCGLGFIFSVMQYVTAVEAPLNQLAGQQQMSLEQNSKVPLYISSITAIVGGLAELDWLMGIGITAWVFFFAQVAATSGRALDTAAITISFCRSLTAITGSIRFCSIGEN